MTDDATTLCRTCGLCCDGTLFAWVVLDAAEAATLAERGLEPVRRDDGSVALRQCCAALRGRDCTVYEDRPATCRRFRCSLLVALQEREVGLADALATVGEAHEAIRAVSSTLGLPEPIAGVMVRARRESQPSEALTAARGRVEALLRRHFIGRQR